MSETNGRAISSAPRPRTSGVGSPGFRPPQTGRRTEVDRAEKVIDAVASGMTLTKALEINNLQAIQFYRAINQTVPELRQAYAQAQEIRSDLLADQTLEIADNPELDYNTARNRIQARQWLISKQAPRTYGDRVDMHFSGSVSVAQALAEANARVNRTPQILDAETVPTLDCASPADDDNLDDIFK